MLEASNLFRKSHFIFWQVALSEIDNREKSQLRKHLSSATLSIDLRFSITMPRAKKSAETWNYETSVEQIEAIITDLETGELPLADIFEQFEKAVAELKKCDSFLQEKQQQAQLLIETLMPEEPS